MIIDLLKKMIYASQGPLINFSDILYVYKFREGEVRHHEVRDHTLVFVYSGELTIRQKHHETLVVGKGSCVFLARNNKVEVSGRPADSVEFKGTFLTLKRQLLIRYYSQLDRSLLPSKDEKRMPDVMLLPQDLHVSSLFQSLTTFFIAWQKPTKQYMELKEVEAVEGLIDIDRRFCMSLFDFVSEWKPDIMEFMEQNYKEDITLSDMALFTGRSLAAFKRDFAKLSDLTPQRWVTRRRLLEARRLIEHEGKRASNIYLQLGFKGLPHFSTAFKKEFGILPSELLTKPL